METGKLLKKFWVNFSTGPKFTRIMSLVVIVIFTALSRILPHPPNFTPVGGIALFSGAYLSGISAFIFPLLIMALSDVVIGLHSTMLYVYGSFVLIVLVGRLIPAKFSFKRLVGSSLASSLVFFIITNFGVWMSSNIYSKDLNGLMQSYFMGIPFFKNTLIGDMFYTLTLFYGLHFITLVAGRSLFFRFLSKKSS